MRLMALGQKNRGHFAVRFGLQQVLLIDDLVFGRTCRKSSRTFGKSPQLFFCPNATSLYTKKTYAQ